MLVGENKKDSPKAAIEYAIEKMLCAKNAPKRNSCVSKYHKKLEKSLKLRSFRLFRWYSEANQIRTEPGLSQSGFYVF